MAGHRLEHGFKTLVLWRFCDGRRPCPKEKYQILGRRVDETIWTTSNQLKTSSMPMLVCMHDRRDPQVLHYCILAIVSKVTVAMLV